LNDDLEQKLYSTAQEYFVKHKTDDYWHFSMQYFNGNQVTFEIYSAFGGYWLNFQLKSNKPLLNTIKLVPIEKMKKGGRTIAQTPAPKKDRVYGSEINKEGSSKDIKSASSIKFSKSVVESLINKIDEHNKKYPKKKIDLATAKSVVRRGMGAYSSSHRPTISGGRPNSRVAWGIARLNAFIYKVINGKSKSGKYNQDDDLIKELGYKVKNYSDGGELNEEAQQLVDIISMNPKLEKYQKYKVILKDKYGVDFDAIYKDQEYIDSANLNDIKNKSDFLDFENWLKYAKIISNKRGFIPMDSYLTPSNEYQLTDEIWNETSKKLDFIVEKVPYEERGTGSGDIASAFGGKIYYTDYADLYYFLHEIAHIYDFKNELEGIVKNPAYSPTNYGTNNGGETFAENFAIYFINPQALKNWNEEDRPREKFLEKGKNAMTNAELLAIIMSSGNAEENAVELARRILKDADNSIDVLGKYSLKELMQYKVDNDLFPRVRQGIQWNGGAKGQSREVT
jgi:hypothetical protein